MSEIITPLIQDYIVDFASNNNFFFVKGVQGDGYGVRYARLSLSNNGQPYIINSEDVRAIIIGTKPDTKEICNECEIVDSSTIQFELTQQMLAVPGKGEYSIAIMSTTTNQILKSFPFVVFSNQASFDVGYITSSNEFTLLVNKINQVDKLNDDVEDLIDRTEKTINNCEKQTENCIKAKNDAVTATNDLRNLESSVTKSENARVQSELERETIFNGSVQAAEKATNDAIIATNDLRVLESNVETAETSRVEAENLRQINTASAISNAEQATQDAIIAKQNADIATSNANTSIEEAQKRIDEYDSLDLINVTNATIEATKNANTATTNTNQAISNAEQATVDAIVATENCIKAFEDIQDALGINDTQISLTTTWSSLKIQETITNDIEIAIEDFKTNKIKALTNEEIDTIF